LDQRQRAIKTSLLRCPLACFQSTKRCPPVILLLQVGKKILLLGFILYYPTPPITLRGGASSHLISSHLSALPPYSTSYIQRLLEFIASFFFIIVIGTSVLCADR
jgi:hypothetical protein